MFPQLQESKDAMKENLYTYNNIVKVSKRNSEDKCPSLVDNHYHHHDHLSPVLI